ncbi:MAG: undecaprenyl-diphosphate phosphatase [Candidatus Fervidibacter sp.]|uniref:undecaprenyl-diphosphate phosphatase n=1 Tax=Candidatus Fervidibacter sp. TaxID=3100871 RepID=UPI00404A6972
MGLVEMLLLAVVQGLTEFLPVSSSGHLALIEHCLKIPEEARLSVTVVLHFGTMLALLVYFRKDLWLMIKGAFKGDEEGRRLIGYVLLANLVTAPIALALNQKVEQAFNSPKFVALFLVVTAFLLLASEQVTVKKQNSQPLSWWHAALIGLAQGVAVFPGLSRSGTTISVGLLCWLGREQAGRFAFVVGIPAMFGANLMEAKDVASLTIGFFPLILATIVAFGMGLAAIHWTLKAVQAMKLRWFSAYCVLVAIFAFSLSVMRL